METLRKVLQQAETKRVAIGHFNISGLVMLKAVFEAARLALFSTGRRARPAVQ